MTASLRLHRHGTAAREILSESQSGLVRSSPAHSPPQLPPPRSRISSSPSGPQGPGSTVQRLRQNLQGLTHEGSFEGPGLNIIRDVQGECKATSPADPGCQGQSCRPAAALPSSRAPRARCRRLWACAWAAPASLNRPHTPHLAGSFCHPQTLWAGQAPSDLPDGGQMLLPARPAGPFSPWPWPGAGVLVSRLSPVTSARVSPAPPRRPGTQ